MTLHRIARSVSQLILGAPFDSCANSYLYAKSGAQGTNAASESDFPVLRRADSHPNDDPQVSSPSDAHSTAPHFNDQQISSPKDALFSPSLSTRHVSGPHDYKKIIRHLQKKIEKLNTQLGESESRFEQAQNEWEEADRHRLIKSAQEYSRLADIISEKDRTIGVMKEQESELRRTLLFLTSEDRCSAADVTALVKALNYEILQVSVAAAEELAARYLARRRDEPAPIKGEVLSKWMENFVDSRFYSELEAANHKEDITLLQLAFQALLCWYCKRSIEAWDKDTSGSLSHSLGEIYRAMKSKEPQSVFAQWRALTQRQLNDIAAEKKPISLASKLEARMVDFVHDAHIRHSNQLSEWARSVTDRLHAIESHVDRIKGAITLDFVSGDLTAVYVRPGRFWDSKEMREAFVLDKNTRGDRVACTTELGLRLTRKVTMGDRSYEESRLLLEPQVFLDSALYELVQSQCRVTR